MSVTRYPWLSLALGAVIGLVATGSTLFNPNSGTEDFTAALRLTGRLSFLLFLVPLVARPIQSFFQNKVTDWLVLHRGNFGLAMVGNHVVHLALIVVLAQLPSEFPAKPIEIWGGAFGMFYLAIMATLTFQAPARLVGRKITGWVHRYILYYLIFVFMYDFLLKEPWGTYPLFAAIWITAVGIRFVAWMRGFLVRAQPQSSN